MELINVATELKMLKSLRLSGGYIWDNKVFVFREHNKKPSAAFSATHRENDVSNVDASVLINSAAFHYALHYHTGTVDCRAGRGKLTICCMNKLELQTYTAMMPL